MPQERDPNGVLDIVVPFSPRPIRNREAPLDFGPLPAVDSASDIPSERTQLHVQQLLTALLVQFLHERRELPPKLPEELLRVHIARLP